MQSWECWGPDAERLARERGLGVTKVEVDEAEVRRRIAFMEELLPTLSGDEKAHAHCTLATLYELASWPPDPILGVGTARDHAQKAMLLGCTHGGPMRLTSRAFIRRAWGWGPNPLPETSSAADRTYLCREIAPEDFRLYRVAVDRREPLLQTAFTCAERAVACDPGDERNEEALDDVVAELRELLDVKEALARAPAVGAGVAG